MTGMQRLGWALAAGVGGAAVARARRHARAVDFNGKSVVIFGGSRGLGLLIARELAAEGAALTLVARDMDELQRAAADVEAYGGSVTVQACDIRDRTQVENTIESVAATHNGIDVLVNDAGIIQVGPFSHMSVADFENAMATHFWGPLYATLAVLPHMRRSGAKRIVNISSIGGKIAVPHLLPYTASKFALTGFSEGLRAELAREGIRVTTVCPGLMRTGSTYNASFKGQHRREFAWFHLSSSLPGWTIDGRRAARQIVTACRYGNAELVITPQARLAVVLNAVSPAMMAGSMAVANKLLPSPSTANGDTARSGWQSVSRVAPSPLTRLTDRATAQNNEA